MRLNCHYEARSQMQDLEHKLSRRQDICIEGDISICQKRQKLGHFENSCPDKNYTFLDDITLMNVVTKIVQRSA